MSATPTRFDWPAALDSAAVPHSAGSGHSKEPASLLEPNHGVLESIASHDALRALRAFSALHEQILNRRLTAGWAPDSELFGTENFVLDEVLQLVCDRVYALTHSDGVVIGLTRQTAPKGSKSERPEIVCRASAGPLAILRGISFPGESSFLRESLENGRILRCDDCEIDPRTQFNFARQSGARSSVLIPLRGRRQTIGVLQAVSRKPRAFTDNDVRCFDLFAELILSALKPQDQDRRIHWLSDVADDLLRFKPQAATKIANHAADGLLETSRDRAETAIPEVAAIEKPAGKAAPGKRREPSPILFETPLAEPAIEKTAAGRPLLSGSFLQPAAPAGNPHPGLNVVMGLVAVAALFSAGVWWGMQLHGEQASSKAAIVAPAKTASPAIASAPAASVPALGASDNLMSSPALAEDSASLTAVPAEKLAALPKVMGLRHWSSSMGSTVVIDMEDQVPYEVHRLMSPERIYFDLHDTALAAELAGKTVDVDDPSLTRLRVAQPVAGVTRVVLDTKDGSNFSVSMESSPYRLVIELRGSDKALAASPFAPKETKLSTAAASPAFAPAKSTPQATLAVNASTSPLLARTGKFRIVLDAGHGGWDLGTVGREGLLEKDLVLDVTQRLGKLLQARLGSEVMLTRTDDTYLPLEQRADIANQSQADLFVSVHANYSTSAAARGVETYYTNLFSAPGSREVEKQADGTLAKLTPVSMTSGGLHEKIAESRRLAASVQRSLYSTLAANSPGIRDRGIKDAAFVVLTGTTMPAILTEISFVSSPTDEHNLQSATYRQQIAEALYKGIAGYEQSGGHAKIAQFQKPSAR